MSNPALLCARCGHSAGYHGLLVNDPRPCDLCDDCPEFVSVSIQPGNHPAPASPFEQMRVLASFVLPMSTQPPPPPKDDDKP